MTKPIAPKETRDQRTLLFVAKSTGAHSCGVTALHGWARFMDAAAALVFTQCDELAGAKIQTYSQGNQTAVDWTITNRHGNNHGGNRQVVR